MAGSLLTMKETAQELFGESDANARKRALYLLKKNDIKLIKSGRYILCRRDVLQKHFGVDQNTAESLSTASVSSPDWSSQ